MSQAVNSNLKRIAENTVYRIPGAKNLVQRLRHKKPPPEFVGWGMSTNRVPPWANADNKLAQDFLKVHNEVVQAVKDGRFRLTQFETMKELNIEKHLKTLMWRHFMVFWTARFAANANGKSIAECGVCDGLTVYFAMKALNNSKKAYLYDIWGKMPGEMLLDSEKRHAEDYEYLSLDTTKKNLEGLDAVYVKGFIPDSFKTVDSPKDVVWLHIDLNASQPTKDSLEEFYDKMPPGGVILFDDYAGRAFADTREVVNAFFADKNGIFLPMPTGQGVFFKW